MTRADLERLYYLKRDLMMWQQRRAELEADIAPPIKNIDGMPHSQTNKITNPTQDKAIRLAQATKIIDGKINEIQITIAEIETFIISINDPFIRQIIEYRCVYCMSWDMVARQIGNHCKAETIRQAYHRFVKTLERKAKS